MTVKIHKIFKDDLSEDASTKVVEMANTTGITISHFAGSLKSTEATITFEIEGAPYHVPYIDDVDFCLVGRKKVDLKALGSDGKIKKDIGKDIGKYKYTDRIPNFSLDLPPGFQELYKS